MCKYSEEDGKCYNTKGCEDRYFKDDCLNDIKFCDWNEKQKSCQSREKITETRSVLVLSDCRKIDKQFVCENNEKCDWQTDDRIGRSRCVDKVIANCTEIELSTVCTRLSGCSWVTNKCVKKTFVDCRHECCVNEKKGIRYCSGVYRSCSGCWRNSGFCYGGGNGCGLMGCDHPCINECHFDYDCDLREQSDTKCPDHQICEPTGNIALSLFTTTRQSLNSLSYHLID